MDELNIVSKFTNNIISKIIQTVIRKKTGCSADIRINQINVAVDDGSALVHLDINAKISKTELVKILKNLGMTI